METVRSKFLDMVKTKVNMEDDKCTDLEIGVYNWTIEFCDENHIVKNWKNTKFVRVYTDKARSVIANIDVNAYVQNKRLITRLNEGEFVPHEIATMTPDCVLPEVWRDTIDAYIRKTENAYEEKAVSMSNQFICSRCKKREVVYFEKQTRSGDEGTSLFIACISCGNRWRIG